MKFYYDATNEHAYGEQPNLELAKTIRLVPWTQQLEDKMAELANANDWDNPLMNLLPISNPYGCNSMECAEVANEAEARELLAQDWAKSWFEYTHDL